MQPTLGTRSINFSGVNLRFFFYKPRHINLLIDFQWLGNRNPYQSSRSRFLLRKIPCKEKTTGKNYDNNKSLSAFLSFEWIYCCQTIINPRFSSHDNDYDNLEWNNIPASLVLGQHLFNKSRHIRKNYHSISAALPWYGQYGWLRLRPPLLIRKIRLFHLAPKMSFIPNNTRIHRFTIHYKSSQNKRERVSKKPIF
jgi:hypothetical protein